MFRLTLFLLGCLSLIFSLTPGEAQAQKGSRVCGWVLENGPFPLAVVGEVRKEEASYTTKCDAVADKIDNKKLAKYFPGLGDAANVARMNLMLTELTIQEVEDKEQLSNSSGWFVKSNALNPDYDAELARCRGSFKKKLRQQLDCLLQAREKFGMEIRTELDDQGHRGYRKDKKACKKKHRQVMKKNKKDMEAMLASGKPMQVGDYSERKKAGKQLRSCLAKARKKHGIKGLPKSRQEAVAELREYMADPTKPLPNWKRVRKDSCEGVGALITRGTRVDICDNMKHSRLYFISGSSFDPKDLEYEKKRKLKGLGGVVTGALEDAAKSAGKYAASAIKDPQGALNDVGDLAKEASKVAEKNVVKYANKAAEEAERQAKAAAKLGMNVVNTIGDFLMELQCRATVEGALAGGKALGTVTKAIEPVLSAALKQLKLPNLPAVIDEDAFGDATKKIEKMASKYTKDLSDAGEAATKNFKKLKSEVFTAGFLCGKSNSERLKKLNSLGLKPTKMVESRSYDIFDNFLVSTAHAAGKGRFWTSWTFTPISLGMSTPIPQTKAGLNIGFTVATDWKGAVKGTLDFGGNIEKSSTPSVELSSGVGVAFYWDTVGSDFGGLDLSVSVAPTAMGVKGGDIEIKGWAPELELALSTDGPPSALGLNLNKGVDPFDGWLPEQLGDSASINIGYALELF